MGSTVVHSARSTIVSMENTPATLGERLRQARKDAQLSQSALAEAAGVTKQAISKIEHDLTSSPATSTLEPIARALQVSLRWLLTGHQSGIGKGSDGLILLSGDPWVEVLAVRQPADLKEPIRFTSSGTGQSLQFHADALRKRGLERAKLAVIFAQGDSMVPTIKDGDAILVDVSDRTPQDGKLYAISIAGDLLTKRLVELGGRWFIESDNRSDPKWGKPQPLDGISGIEIHGRVRWIGSWED